MTLYCFESRFALVAATLIVAPYLNVSAINPLGVNAAYSNTQNVPEEVLSAVLNALGGQPARRSITNVFGGVVAQTNAFGGAVGQTSTSSTNGFAGQVAQSSTSSANGFAGQVAPPPASSSTTSASMSTSMSSTQTPELAPTPRLPSSTSAPTPTRTSSTQTRTSSTSMSGLPLTSTSAPALASTSESLTSISTPNSSSFKTSNTNVSVIAGGITGSVIGGSLITALIFWLYMKHKTSKRVAQISLRTSERKIPLSHASTIESATHAQPVSQLTRQEFYGPDDIPTSTTIPRARDEMSEPQLPRTMGQYWGQVGQYYHGVGEV